MGYKKRVKSWVGKIHLWLGLASGLLVLFLGITGCMLAFQREIEDATQDYRFTQAQTQNLLPPSVLKKIADKELPGKLAHSISYQNGKSSQVTYFNAAPEYYHIVFLNAYSGKVLKVKDMDRDFFRIILMGHYYLWLPPNIGQPLLASATLIFVIMLVTGLVLWWPKNKAASAKRFSIKWNTKWRRLNYDMHNVIGFYVSWVAIFIAVTGLVMGFQWFSTSVYWLASGGKQLIPYSETFSGSIKTARAGQIPAIDQIWLNIRKNNPAFTGRIEVHPPVKNKSAIEVAVNPDTDTYWKTDYRYYDQYTLREIPVKHIYGDFEKASTADKMMRMNYDIHIGAIGGIAGKTIAFFASLFAASLPVTGFIIWLGRKRKKKQAKQQLITEPSASVKPTLESTSKSVDPKPFINQRVKLHQRL